MTALVSFSETYELDRPMACVDYRGLPVTVYTVERRSALAPAGGQVMVTHTAYGYCLRTDHGTVGTTKGRYKLLILDGSSRMALPALLPPVPAAADALESSPR